MSNKLPQYLRTIYDENEISEEIINLSEILENKLIDKYQKAEYICEHNTIRILNAFKNVKLSDTHFAASTGYGYSDIGRERIESAFAEIFGAKKALVRNQISSGTTAIAIALFGVLRPGDTLLSVTGSPYDTLMDTIGITGDKGNGSLKDFGVNYKQVDFTPKGKIDFSEIEKNIDNATKVIFIQKSKGYSDRKDLLIEDIEKIVKFVKGIKEDVIVMVDNCYGEFVETKEPCHVGADLCVGSLIKNPGGGICLTGGYIVGNEDLVEMASCRLNAPGVGSHVGPSLGFNQTMAQGLFLAPRAVCESIKGAIFASALFEELGFDVMPKWNDYRGDIVQTLTLHDEKKLINFCSSIQNCSPVDSFATPEPWDMPGYNHKVIMAAGNFVGGSSSELSCDAPIKPPYIVYMQGGLVYGQVKFASMVAASKMKN